MKKLRGLAGMVKEGLGHVRVVDVEGGDGHGEPATLGFLAGAADPLVGPVESMDHFMPENR